MIVVGVASADSPHTRTSGSPSPFTPIITRGIAGDFPNSGKLIPTYVGELIATTSTGGQTSGLNERSWLRDVVTCVRVSCLESSLVVENGEFHGGERLPFVLPTLNIVIGISHSLSVIKPN